MVQMTRINIELAKASINNVLAHLVKEESNLNNTMAIRELQSALRKFP